MTANVAELSGALSVLLLLSACEAKSGSDDDVGAEIDELCKSDCNEPVQCLRSIKPDPGPGDWKVGASFCVDDQPFSMDLVLRHAEIINHCRLLMGVSVTDQAEVDWEFVSCPGLQPGECPDWSPAEQVTARDGNSYGINAAFVDDLVANPGPLADCDTAVLIVGGDGLTVRNVSTSDFIAAIGLREGDVIHSINGHRLETWSDAVGSLVYYRRSDETHFDVNVSRGDAAITLHYELTP